MNKMKTIVVKRSKQKILKAENLFVWALSLSLATYIESLVRFTFALLWGKFVTSLLFEPYITEDWKLARTWVFIL